MNYQYFFRIAKDLEMKENSVQVDQTLGLQHCTDCTALHSGKLSAGDEEKKNDFIQIS